MSSTSGRWVSTATRRRRSTSPRATCTRPTPTGRDSRSSATSSTRPGRGSVYHLTKSLDQLLFQFYAQNDGVRVTDLHQGIVWGTQTEETRLDRAADQPLRLRRRLRDGAEPLPDAGRDRPSAHRARDRRADPGLHQHPGHRALHPPRRGVRATEDGRVRIMNQVDRDPPGPRPRPPACTALGAEVDYVPNPRAEAAENELAVAPTSCGARARPDPARGGPASGVGGDRREVRRPL